MSGQDIKRLLKTVATTSEPLYRIPDNGDVRQRGSSTPLRTIDNDKNLSINKNVRQKPIQIADKDQVEYYAKLLADKLNDQKSLSYYRLVCARYNPAMLLQKAAEIVGDGGARKPGAVFVDWLKTLQVH